MGACATKSGDLKVKGEAPLVVDDGAVPPVPEGEKAKADGVPAAAEADTPDAGRRRSLSDLLKEDAETSDVEADQEAEKAVILMTEAPATAAYESHTGATKEAEAPVQPPVEAEQDDTAEELGDPKDDKEHGDDAQVVEEDKRVDPDSVQVAAADATSAAASADEEHKVTDDTSSAAASADEEHKVTDDTSAAAASADEEHKVTDDAST
ncbi:hypothetical protein ACP4OV_005846 [Aristida adscensionis]